MNRQEVELVKPSLRKNSVKGWLGMAINQTMELTGSNTAGQGDYIIAGEVTRFTGWLLTWLSEHIEFDGKITAETEAQTTRMLTLGSNYCVSG